jgi:hypothetical protein
MAFRALAAPLKRIRGFVGRARTRSDCTSGWLRTRSALRSLPWWADGLFGASQGVVVKVSRGVRNEGLKKQLYWSPSICWAQRLRGSREGLVVGCLWCQSRDLHFTNGFSVGDGSGFRHRKRFGRRDILHRQHCEGLRRCVPTIVRTCLGSSGVSDRGNGRGSADAVLCNRSQVCGAWQIVKGRSS